MTREISLAAWILFFAGMPIAFAEHACTHDLGRYFGWGWGGGRHWCAPNNWYGSPGCGMTMDAGCIGCESTMPTWETPMMYPAYQAATRYYVPPVGQQPTMAPRTRTANALHDPAFARPSTLQSR